MRSRLLPLVLLLAACAPNRIPDTQIPDSVENRAVYEVIRQYAEALRSKNAAAVLLLVSPNYLDNSGTPDPSDDVTLAILERSLVSDLAKVEAVNLDLGVKRIEVNVDVAVAEVFYDAAYRITTPSGPVAKRPSDISQMRFRKLQGAWKITSGL